MRDSRIGHNGGPEIEPHIADLGYTKEYRSSMTHPVIGYGKQVTPFDPERKFCFSVNEAWRDMVNGCRYKDGQVMNGHRVMTLYRGQLVGAVSWLANRWNWSPRTVRTFLERLENEGMIKRYTPGINPRSSDVSSVDKPKIQNGKQAQVLTICNYLKYQSTPNDERQTENFPEREQPTNERQTSDNNKKERNKEKTTIPPAREAAVAQPTQGQDFYPMAKRIADRLHEDCKPIIGSPAAYVGLLNVSTIVGWLEQGCDAHKDIYYPIKARCEQMKLRNSRNVAQSWSYFETTVAQAKLAREKPLPDVPDAPMNGYGRPARVDPMEALEKWAKN